ncbi:MAG: hypothetical protein ACRCZI_03275, partial [Cetobacterium sp.]
MLSISTGLVSPQYHVVFDPSFKTVHPEQSNQVPEYKWMQKCGFKGRAQRDMIQGNQIQEESQFISPTDVAIMPEPEGGPTLAESDFEVRINEEGTPTTLQPLSEESVPEPSEQSIQNESAQPQREAQTNTALRRSARQNKGVRTQPTFQSMQEKEMLRKEMIMDEKVPGEIFSFGAMHEHRNPRSQVLEVLSATGDPDTMYYHQAMKQPDARDFLRAVHEEFAGMLSNQILSFIELTRVPPGTTVFPAVWAMKRKRR